jgi:hypothetical protein
LDDLAKQLISLELAIPGVYAAILKLVSGEKANLEQPLSVLMAFTAWLLALGFTLASLLPLRDEIDPDSPSDIQRYFSDSARRKFMFLSVACLSSFAGICLAVFSIF